MSGAIPATGRVSEGLDSKAQGAREGALAGIEGEEVVRLKDLG